MPVCEKTKITFKVMSFKVYEETVTAGQASSGTFVLDAPLGRNVRLVAHCADEGDLDAVQVFSPSGRVYDLPLVADGMLHIRIAETEEFGEWNYRLRFASANGAATVEVTAQPNDNTQAIIVSAWTNVGRRPVNASETPIILYAEVSLNGLPVLDAQVVALIHPPPGNSTDLLLQPFVIRLHDRGTGG